MERNLNGNINHSMNFMDEKLRKHWISRKLGRKTNVTFMSYIVLALILGITLGFTVNIYSISHSPLRYTDIAPKNSQIQPNITVISQGNSYWHNVNGYSTEIGSEIVIGHDFDFWNEEWRSWITLNLTQIPDSVTITSVGLDLSIEGKPEVCDEVDGQIFIMGMNQNPASIGSSHLIFDLIGNSTQSLGDWSLIDEDSMFSISQNISLELNQAGQEYFTSSLERNWAALGFSDYFDGGSDSDSDEGLQMVLNSVTIGFTYLNESGMGRYDRPADNIDPITDDEENDLPMFLPIALGSILIVGILFLIIRFGPQSKKTPYIRNKSSTSEKIYPFRQSSTKKAKSTSKREQRKREKALLYKFQKIIKISKSVSMEYVAGHLEISKQELFDLLIAWNSRLPFKIDGEMIIVDDLDDFLVNLDKNFSEWDDKSNSKIGKN